MGKLSDFNPFKPAKKILKKVAKPFRKIGKFLPKEARSFMPFLSAAVPFMLPAGGFGASGLFSSAAGRGFLSSLANVGGQAMADPEGEDINLLSALMAGGTGYLSGQDVASNLRKGIVDNSVTGADAGEWLAAGQDLPGPGFWQGAENIGREGLATASDFITGAGEGLASLGKNPKSLFTKAGAKAAAMDIAPIAVQGTGDMAKSMADQQWRAFDDAEAAAQAEFDATSTADKQERADLTMRYYREAGHDEETIQTALETNDLGEFYEPPEAAAQGGIIGLKHGGMLNFGGREMDLRTGGFVPIGRKERADDVPARLSKNEFVMTADAVRAAGGGSVNKGAQRMYDVMNKLEARA